MTQYWDQPRIAAEFGVSMSSVQGGWRNRTLRAIRQHLAEHGVDESALGCTVDQVDRAGWDEARRRLGLRPLHLPKIALPIPDLLIGSKPVWAESSMQRWANDTGRRGDDGSLRRASPPGRPVSAAR